MPIVLKSGSLDLLEPLGPVQACNGIALPLPKNTVNALGVGWSVVRFQGGERYFSSVQNILWALGPTQPRIESVPGIFPGGYNGRSVNLTTPIHCEVKNEWSYTTSHLPPLCHRREKLHLFTSAVSVVWQGQRVWPCVLLGEDLI